jgi:hypothetical protein
MAGQSTLLKETAIVEMDHVEAYSNTNYRRSFFLGVKRRDLSATELSALGDQMVQALSDDEKEHAARSSYTYLWKSVNTPEQVKESKAFIEEQNKMAKAMAMRFLKSKKGNYDVAIQKFRSAIKFRKEWDVDGLRLCFQADKLDLDDATRKRYAMYRERLSERMPTGRAYVCGYDKEGRAIYTIYAARTKDFDPEWFLKESIFNLEKALACTERESSGLKESITVIGNYTGFQSKHSAPMSISHRFMDILRQNYPGRVHRVFLLRTPFSFLMFWSLLKPVSFSKANSGVCTVCECMTEYKFSFCILAFQFIGTDTREKIIFLSELHRQEEFADLVSLDQAAPWMLDGGRKIKEFDANEYLNKIPFDECFDP